MGLKISWITVFTYVCDQIQENLASLHSVIFLKMQIIQSILPYSGYNL